MTRSYAELDVSKACYDEIARKLLAAGYDHCFVVGTAGTIDMHGIALVAELAPAITDLPDFLPARSDTFMSKPER